MRFCIPYAIDEVATMKSISGALMKYEKESAAGSTSASGANRSVCDGDHRKGDHHGQG